MTLLEAKRLESPSDLEQWRDALCRADRRISRRVRVCIGPGCFAKGAPRLYELFKRAAEESGTGVEVQAKCVGCHGLCTRGPIVIVEPGNIFYQSVEEPDVAEIFRETVIGGRLVERLLYEDPVSHRKAKTADEIPFYKAQQRIALAGNGLLDPASLEDYLVIGGYAALAKALTRMKPEEVLAEVEKSGLRGRGGGGFPTGRKWRSCREARGEPKYVICNGDEGDPGPSWTAPSWKATLTPSSRG